MKIVLLTTCIVSGELPDVVERMLRSVAQQMTAAPEVEVHHLILVQGRDLDVQPLAAPMPHFVTLLSSAQRMSLSKARNVLLERAAGAIEAADFVGFPDDDAWYPGESLVAISAEFAKNSDLDFLFCRYGSAAKGWDGKTGKRHAKASDVVRQASSNTLFVASAIVRQIGGFDEALGVGSPNNGGEDIDYALRCFLRARTSIFVDAAIVGHRDKDPSLRAKYFKGSVIALRKSAFKDLRIFMEYARKLAVGLALLLQRQLPYRPAPALVANSSRRDTVDR